MSANWLKTPVKTALAAWPEFVSAPTATSGTAAPEFTTVPAAPLRFQQTSPYWQAGNDAVWTRLALAAADRCFASSGVIVSAS
jgi:hypothetical protein